MKNLKVVMLAALAAVGLAGCGECQHVDENKDHKCDKCSAVLSECKDENPADHNCDYCGTKLSDCKDDNKDHNCDICGTKLSDHVDSNHDGKCDYCEQTGIPFEHIDANHDGKCDVEACGFEGLEVHHVDLDGDGFCDSEACGKAIIVESFEFDASKAKKQYVLGEAFDKSGVVVIGQTTDEKEISIPFEVKAPDMTTPGSKTVEVTFTVNGVEEKRTFEIEISYWDAESLALLDTYTLPGHFGGIYLPYISGLRTVEDDETGEFYLSKENATVDDLKLFGNLMRNVVEVEGADEDIYTFQQLEDIEGLAEYYGFERCYAFYCIPYTYQEEVDPETGEVSYYPVRDYTIDEYYVAGLTEQGELKVFVRDVFALLDGYMGGNENLNDKFDVELILKAGLTPDYFYAAAADLPGYYCTSLAYDKFVFPEFNGSVGTIGLASLKTLYPFDDSLDDYLIVEEIELMGASEAEFNGFVSALTSAGYEATPNTEYGYTDYVFADPYVGEIEYRLFDFDPNYVTNTYSAAAAESLGYDEGYVFELYYTSPFEFGGRYANAYSEELDNVTGELIEGHEIGVAEYYGDYDPMGDYYDGLLGFVVPEGEEAPSVEDAFALLEGNLPATYVFEEGGNDEDSYENEYQYKIFNNGTFCVEFDVYEDLISGLRAFEVYVFDGEETMDTFAQKVALAVAGEDLPEFVAGNHYRQFDLDGGASDQKTWSGVLEGYTEALSGLFTFGEAEEDAGFYTVVGEDEVYGFILTIELTDISGTWVARFTLSDKPFIGGAGAAAEAVALEIFNNYGVELEPQKLSIGAYVVDGLVGSEEEEQANAASVMSEAAYDAIENALPYGYTVTGLPEYVEAAGGYVAYAVSKDGNVNYTIVASYALDNEEDPDNSTIHSEVYIIAQDAVWEGTSAMSAILEVARKVELNYLTKLALGSSLDGSYQARGQFVLASGIPMESTLGDVINKIVAPKALEYLLPAGCSAVAYYSLGSGMYEVDFLSSSKTVMFELVFGVTQDSETTLAVVVVSVISYPTPKGTLSDIANQYIQNLSLLAYEGSPFENMVPGYNASGYSVTGIIETGIKDADLDEEVNSLINAAIGCAPYGYYVEQASNPYSAGGGWVGIDFTDMNESFTMTLLYKVTEAEDNNTVEIQLYIYLTPWTGTAEEAMEEICANSQDFLNFEDAEEKDGVYTLSTTVVSATEALKETYLSIAKSIAVSSLPVGCIEGTTSGNTTTYYSADGTVTIEVTVEAVDAGEGNYDINVTVVTYATPAE